MKAKGDGPSCVSAVLGASTVYMETPKRMLLMHQTSPKKKRFQKGLSAELLLRKKKNVVGKAFPK